MPHKTNAPDDDSTNYGPIDSIIKTDITNTGGRQAIINNTLATACK